MNLALGENKIAILATDTAKNQATETIIITRSPNTTVPVLTHATGTGTQSVPYITNSISLGWDISAKGGIASITLNGTPLAVVPTVTKTASLLVGNNPFVLVVTDSSNNTTKDSITITRGGDITPPSIQRIAGTKDTAIPYAISTFTVSWKVSDDVKLGAVAINDTVITGVNGVYSFVAHLMVGPRKVAVLALDSAGHLATDTITITRGGDVTPPSVVRNAGTKDTLLANVAASYTVSWTVADDVKLGLVTIGGGAVNGSAGVFSKVINLTVGTRKVGIVAVDSAGHSSTDTIVLIRSAPIPVHSLASGTYIGMMREAILSTGADSITYSMDTGKTWRTYTDSIAVSSSVKIQARAYPGPATSEVTLKIHRVKPFVFGNASFFLSGDTLWAAGYNAYINSSNVTGQLGTGSDTNQTTQIIVATGVAKIANGAGTSIILKTDKTVMATGQNNGTFGDGTRNSTLSFVPVSGITNIADVLIVSGNSYFLKQDGSLLVSGYTYAGENGTGIPGFVVTPTKILDKVSKVSGSGNETGVVALKTDGTVWAWGGSVGSLGLPDTSYNQIKSPTLIDSGASNVFFTGSQVWFTKADGTLWVRGYNPNPSFSCSDSSVIRTACLYGTGTVDLVGDGGHRFSILSTKVLYLASSSI